LIWNETSAFFSGNFWNTSRQRKPHFWVNWRAVGMDPCALCCRRLCPLAWPTTTADWPVMRGSWWKRPIPQGCSASSPAPLLLLLASTSLHAGLSRPMHLEHKWSQIKLFKPGLKEILKTVEVLKGVS